MWEAILTSLWDSGKAYEAMACTDSLSKFLNLFSSIGIVTSGVYVLLEVKVVVEFCMRERLKNSPSDSKRLLCPSLPRI